MTKSCFVEEVTFKYLMNKTQQRKKIKNKEKLLIQFFSMCYVRLH